ncbi:MAG: hypothetical protein M3486_02280, partial [Actinomycetota bacterium]|nr:hypothetical protein [Actinomycetota bacterium]
QRASGSGQASHFQRGSIFWTAATGAHEVKGSIRDAWARVGWDRGPLGFPTTGEMSTVKAGGRVNHFQGGSVFSTATTGAHPVAGAIRDRWAATGWERGSLGFPISDKYDVPEGRRNDFQRGSIVWDARTGATRIV